MELFDPRRDGERHACTRPTRPQRAASAAAAVMVSSTGPNSGRFVRGSGPANRGRLPDSELRRCSAITPGTDASQAPCAAAQPESPSGCAFPGTYSPAGQPYSAVRARPMAEPAAGLSPGRHTCAAPAHHRGEGRPAAPPARRLEHAGAAVMGDPMTRVKSGVSHHEGRSATNPLLAVGFRSGIRDPPRSHVECHLAERGHLVTERPSQVRGGHESRGPTVSSTSCAVLGAPAAHTESNRAPLRSALHKSLICPSGLQILTGGPLRATPGRCAA